MTFHINKNTHQPSRCKATVKSCPNGGAHFETEQEALEHVEIAAAAEAGDFLSGFTQEDDDRYDEEARREEIVGFISKASAYRDASREVKILGQHKLAAACAREQDSDLVFAEVIGEDEKFKTEGATTTKRLELDDGSFGYWKSLDAQQDDKWVHKEFDSTPAKAMVAEVAAYQFAQRLGLGYEDMVPETVIREYNGELGTLQAESKDSRCLEEYKWGKGEGAMPEDVSEDSFRRAAVFDYLIGSSDRHSGNALVDSRGDLVLIDNSFALRENETHDPLGKSVFANATASYEYQLEDYEVSTIQGLVDSPDLEGMGKYLTKLQVNCIKARARRLLDSTFFYDATHGS